MVVIREAVALCDTGEEEDHHACVEDEDRDRSLSVVACSVVLCWVLVFVGSLFELRPGPGRAAFRRIAFQRISFQRIAGRRHRATSRMLYGVWRVLSQEQTLCLSYRRRPREEGAHGEHHRREGHQEPPHEHEDVDEVGAVQHRHDVG